MFPPTSPSTDDLISRSISTDGTQGDFKSELLSASIVDTSSLPKVSQISRSSLQFDATENDSNLLFLKDHTLLQRHDWEIHAPSCYTTSFCLAANDSLPNVGLASDAIDALLPPLSPPYFTLHSPDAAVSILDILCLCSRNFQSEFLDRVILRSRSVGSFFNCS